MHSSPTLLTILNFSSGLNLEAKSKMNSEIETLRESWGERENVEETY